MEFAHFANLFRSLQLHAPAAWVHVCRATVAVTAVRDQARSANKLATGNRARCGSVVGNYREYERGDRSVSRDYSISWLPRRHCRQFVGRHPGLRSWIPDCAEAWLAALVADLHCHRDRAAVLDSRQLDS